MAFYTLHSLWHKDVLILNTLRLSLGFGKKYYVLRRLGVVRVWATEGTRLDSGPGAGSCREVHVLDTKMKAPDRSRVNSSLPVVALPPCWVAFVILVHFHVTPG